MITLKSKNIKVSTGGSLIVILNHIDAEKLDLRALDRIKIKYRNKVITAVIDISESDKETKPGEIGLFEETTNELELKKSSKLQVEVSNTPRSVETIKKKLDNKELNQKEIENLIKDLVNNELTEIELTFFISACYQNKLNSRETKYLTESIVKYGNKININTKIVADKHCIGGIPNNRTSMLIVPIVTSTGVKMIKTSSRSITSPAGTADTMEVLANVVFPIEKIKSIIKKINGCIVWGGAIDLASADEKLIKVRHPLRLDPRGVMLASIFAKKIAVHSTHILIDIPMGKSAKVTNRKEANSLKRSFEILGKQLKTKTKVIISNGSQPIGNGIGPNLEARDILYILRKDPRAPKDLENKSIKMADIILKMTNTKGSAKSILDSGEAYQQFRKIIKEQGGNPKIKPEDITLGKFKYNYKSNKSGKITEIDNKIISKVARIAGAPKDKEAGIYLYKKLNQKVKKGENILTIYSNSKVKLKYAKTFLKNSYIIK